MSPVLDMLWQWLTLASWWYLLTDWVLLKAGYPGLVPTLRRQHVCEACDAGGGAARL